MADSKQEQKLSWFPSTLRNQLFLGSALLSSAILSVAAWVINHQVIGQARQQVQAEIESLLPLYDVTWDEQARVLAALGTTMANSPIVKTVFADSRASRDRETIHQMMADLGAGLSDRVDLILISDGAGQVTFIEQRGETAPAVGELAAARAIATSQAQQQGFALLGGRPFHLVLTPVLLQSGSAGYKNTFAVLGTGSELNHGIALELKRRLHSELLFFVADQLHASSLGSNAEAVTARALKVSDLSRSEPTRPAEVRVGGEPYLAFSRQLEGFEGQRVGQVVILRSLAGAGTLFRSISNQLLLLGVLSLALALALSYLFAARITQPLESLAQSAREFGRGNYDCALQAQARGEIGQLARAFDQMRQSLKQTQAELLRSERLATIGHMASSIIHDLRNPLATISTAAEVLSGNNLSAERRQVLLESQLRAAQRMNDMLKELLEFSRGRYQLATERHSLAQLIGRALRELSAYAAQAGIMVESCIPVDLFVKADAERLRRVFENLLFNSIQAMPDGGKLTLRAAAHGACVRVDVIDTGPGVPAQIREQLFEPFVSHAKQGGLGLGLAIAKKIVEAHGGSIGLDQAVEQGADFYLELPLDTGGSDGAEDPTG